MVWRPGTTEPSAALSSALIKRDLRVQTTDSRHEALAVACVAHRKGEALVVVLDRADDLHQRERTLESIERFAPGALVWVFDERANPPLRAFVPQAAPAPRPAAPPPRPASAGGPRSGPKPPGLRLTGSEPDGPISSADVLNQDELDALLGRDEA